MPGMPDKKLSATGSASHPFEAKSAADLNRESWVRALGWMTDRLSAMLPRPEIDLPPEPQWGADASSSPADYWRWIDAKRAGQADDEDGSTGTLAVAGPLLSVVVPVYRPEIWYFRACVESVLRQTYGRWELCLCDDGSADPELTAAMSEFAAADDRIRVVALDANQGISHATNRAIEMANGEFIVLLDHDDELTQDALAEIAQVTVGDDLADVIYSDEDKLDETDRRFMPHFKPDWDPDLLLAYPYLGHVTVIRTELLRRIGGFRSDFDGSQDYDMMLRATEVARRIVHVPKVLYHWRVVVGSASGDSDAKPWAHVASRRAVEDTVSRRALDAIVESGPFPGSYHVRRRVRGDPTVSVIIPFRDHAALTAACVESLAAAPGYPIHEVLLVDNGSSEPETKALLRRLARRQDIRIISHPGAFNWAAMNNAAASSCEADMLLFLNNDIEATSPDWLRSLVELGQREDVGAVGARLTFPDGRLQHAGVVLGLTGVAGHIFLGKPQGTQGYLWWDRIVRGYAAVTAACMLTRKSVFEEMHGFDEAFAVGFNDVDYCIRAGRAGYRTLYTPHAELTHSESATRGLTGFDRDQQEFINRWSDIVRVGDPAYNVNLGLLKPWCPLRFPDEHSQWQSLLREMIQPDDRIPLVDG